MFRFSIRDVLWLMMVVGMGCALWIERATFEKKRLLWDQEKAALQRKHEADLANERRLASLKAREMAGQLLITPAPPKANSIKLIPTRSPIAN